MNKNTQHEEQKYIANNNRYSFFAAKKTAPDLNTNANQLKK